MRYLIFISFLLFISCSNNNQTIHSFKDLRQGNFKSEIINSDVTSYFSRNNKIQTEKFDDKEYQFSIHWKSDFEYELLNLHPKNALDSTPFVVKITGLHKKFYTFTAQYKGSEFKQKGKTYKLK